MVESWRAIANQERATQHPVCQDGTWLEEDIIPGTNCLEEEQLLRQALASVNLGADLQEWGLTSLSLTSRALKSQEEPHAWGSDSYLGLIQKVGGGVQGKGLGWVAAFNSVWLFCWKQRRKSWSREPHRLIVQTYCIIVYIWLSHVPMHICESSYDQTRLWCSNVLSDLGFGYKQIPRASYRVNFTPHIWTEAWQKGDFPKPNQGPVPTGLGVLTLITKPAKTHYRCSATWYSLYSTCKHFFEGFTERGSHFSANNTVMFGKIPVISDLERPFLSKGN